MEKAIVFTLSTLAFMSRIGLIGAFAAVKYPIK